MPVSTAYIHTLDHPHVTTGSKNYQEPIRNRLILQTPHKGSHTSQPKAVAQWVALPAISVSQHCRSEYPPWSTSRAIVPCRVLEMKHAGQVDPCELEHPHDIPLDRSLFLGELNIAIGVLEGRAQTPQLYSDELAAIYTREAGVHDRLTR
jgi:hypothetical protein